MGHYSSNCPKCSSGQRSVAYAEAISDKLGVELVNAVEEEELAFREHQSSTNGREEEEVVLLNEALDDEHREDIWSLNDWCSHVRAEDDSDYDREVMMVWSSAIHLLPEDECPVAESLKVAKLDDGQVAYCLHSTKDLGQLWVEDGPRRDFKSHGVIEGYM